MKIRRAASLMLALLMMMLLFVPNSITLAEEVPSAPLVIARDTLDGMVRVYLQSIGNTSSLNVTTTGAYTLSGKGALSVSSGSRLAFSVSGGSIRVSMGGSGYDMGGNVRLCRSSLSGCSIKIAESPRSGNFYPGDLELIASGGTMKAIVHVYIEDYLDGVVPYEMSSSYPSAALQAQAVAARTYALRLMNGNASKQYDLGDTASYQVYFGSTGNVTNATQAVDATQGVVAMNGSALTGTYYTSTNGGQTESAKNAWGSSVYPYLRVKDDHFDTDNPDSYVRRRIIYPDFANASQHAGITSTLDAKVQAMYGAGAVIQTINAITPHTPKYAEPSRLYTKMDFALTVWVNGSSRNITVTCDIFDELEAALDISINSGENELWSIDMLDGNFRLTVRRRGHGIGMSQRGAQQMANTGYTYDQILGFYYEGCTRVQHTFTQSILGTGGSAGPTPPPITPAPPVGNEATTSLAGDSIPLRYAASDAGSVITVVPNATRVTVLSKGSAWTLVRYGALNGYLPTSALIFGDAPPASTSEQPTYVSQWAVNTGSSALNFRTGPSYDASVQFELPLNAVLVVLGSSGNFTFCQYGSVTGYAASSYLTFHGSFPGNVPDGEGPSSSPATPTPSPTPTRNPDGPAEGTIGYTTASTGLYAGASSASELLLVVPQSEQITLIAHGSAWCQVSYYGMVGWMQTNQIRFLADGTPTPSPTPTATPTAEPTPYVSTEPTAEPDPVYRQARVIMTTKMREQPNTESALLAVIEEGTIVTVLNWGDSWTRVQYGQLVGYVITNVLYLLPADDNTPTPSPTPTPTPRPVPTETVEDENGRAGWVVPSVQYVNLRKTSSSNGEIIRTIPGGSAITVLSSGSTWANVHYQGAEGYIYARHVTYVNGGEVIGVRYINTALDPLALRNKPTTKGSTVIARIPRGEKVALLETLGDWCCVSWRQYEGYCASRYLSEDVPYAYVEDDTPLFDITLESVSGWKATVKGSAALYLRAWCSTAAPEVCEVDAGATVTVLQKGDIWCKIFYEGEAGYCLTSSLNLIAP